MITIEEIDVLKEWVKELYGSNVDHDVIFLVTKLIVEKENELNQQSAAPTTTIDIPPITINPVSPTITNPRPWNPYSPYEVWGGAGTPIKTDGGTGVSLNEWTTNTTKTK